MPRQSGLRSKAVPVLITRSVPVITSLSPAEEYRETDNVAKCRFYDLAQLNRLQRKLRDFLEIPHVTSQECATGEKSCCRNKTVYQLQAVRCTEVAGNAGDLRIWRDQSNGLQNSFNNLLFLIAQIRIAEKFCLGNRRNVHRSGGVAQDLTKHRNGARIALLVVDNGVRIKRIHKRMSYGSFRSTSLRILLSSLIGSGFLCSHIPSARSQIFSRSAPLLISADCARTLGFVGLGCVVVC